MVLANYPRKNWVLHSAKSFADRRWLLPFFASMFISLTLFLVSVFRLFVSPSLVDSLPSDFSSYIKLEHSISRRPIRLDFANDSSHLPNYLEQEAPRLAYLITGTKGDSHRMRRTLQAIYHPRNQYILHLDIEAPPRERVDLAIYVKGDPIFREVENVRVIATGNLVTYKGPTMIACTLHAIAILLKDSAKWDWFINLSASDYPLMTQDGCDDYKAHIHEGHVSHLLLGSPFLLCSKYDLLHVFSYLPRNLNFIEHNQSTGWKVNQRAKPIIIDPGLYLSRKFKLFLATEHRDLPTAFNLFTGSAWVMLTRSFLEYCTWGWESLPRTILMYYVNFVSSPEGYFHTVICNSNEFRQTTISHDLHYIAWDTPPKQHPRTLTIKDFDKMLKSGAPFARKFKKDDPILDKIDQELLGRSEGQFIPGAWCIGKSIQGGFPCSQKGKDSIFRPGPGALRLQGLLDGLLSGDFHNRSCWVKR